MNFAVKENGKFQYIEEGSGEPIVLLHGLFGAMSNFSDLVNILKERYKVYVPLLPLFSLDIFHTNVGGLQKFVNKFIKKLNLEHVHLLGNSLGGHVALLHTLRHPEHVKTLILTGSSGLYENGMGETYPKRGDKEYIRKKTQETFYDPATATDDLIDEVFEITSNRLKVLKILALAKSAIRNNLSKELYKITAPTLLIWGMNDIVTPPFVGEEFNKLIAGSELHFIDKCGHAPMMERPSEFGQILLDFLQKYSRA